MSQYDFDLVGTNDGAQLIDAFNQSMAAIHSGHIGPSRPSYATEGMVWTKQGSKPQLMYYNGTTDVVLCDLDRPLADQLATPTGSIMMWSGTVADIPSGWSLCNGQNGTPDLRDRFVIGAGGSITPNQTGGNSSTTLVEANLPSHSHGAGTLSASAGGRHTPTGVTNTAGNHDHALPSDGQGNVNSSIQTVVHSSGSDEIISDSNKTGVAGNHAHQLNMNEVPDHTHTVTGSTATTGSGQSFENRPPYLSLCYIMKV